MSSIKDSRAQPRLSGDGFQGVIVADDSVASSNAIDSAMPAELRCPICGWLQGKMFVVDGAEALTRAGKLVFIYRTVCRHRGCRKPIDFLIAPRQNGAAT